ncbi:PD-(D/E)XK nuclease family protein [Aerococcaceae bacterium NML191292]|nr:PD-(D/E)XK nuclease family protein [Aerococcaceae bacterium NML191292]
MVLQFVTGDLKHNKKQALLAQLFMIKQQEPTAKIYYLVPEHLKFDMETYMLEQMQTMSGQTQSVLIDIQVVSFSRLAWFMLPSKLKGQQQLSKVGLTMLVRQLLQQHQANLTVYRGQIRYQGFVERLVALFEELYEGNVTPDNLLALQGEVVSTINEPEQLNLFTFVSEDSLQSRETLSPLEKQRLKELALLYDAFCEQIAEQSLANFQLYRTMQDYLTEVGKLANHYIVVDHHYYFNAHQMGLVLALAKSFEKVWLTLPLTHIEAQQTEWSPLIETQRSTYQQIRQLCQFEGIEVTQDWEIEADYAKIRSEILTVASHFRRYYQLAMPTYHGNLATQSTHTVWQCDTPQTELRHISNQIHELVNRHGYRYRDILIVSRNMSRYQQMVEPIFARNEIPLFFDHETKMSEHPFMLWLEACLNLPKYRWRYADVMGVLKSPLFKLSADSHATYLFENILLANGYFAHRLTNLQYEWQFAQRELTYVDGTGTTSNQTVGEVVDNIRTQFLSTLMPHFQKWSATLTGEVATSWLYNLVTSTGVRTQLEDMRDAAIERGDLDESRRHEQIWQVFKSTLEEFHTLYADTPIDYDTFCEIIMAGLNEGTYHIIPPTLDQVTFTSMESPQVKPYKVCFIVGADEFTLPKKVDYQSLLSIQNRELIREQLLPHQYLMHQSEQQANQEYLLMYQLLLNATDRLYVSYASNLGTQTVKLTPYWQQLANAFQLPIESLNETAFVPTNFGRFDMQLTPILSEIRRSYEEEELPSLDVRSLIQQLESYAPHYLGTSLWHFISKTFNFSQLPTNLSSKTALQLFGKHINASVSKIERYYQDPYSHFLLYGLKVRERDLFEVNPAKTGDYFHAFMEQFVDALNKQGIALSQLTAQQFEAFFGEVKSALEADYQYNLFQSHPRMRAIKAQMDRRLAQFIRFTQRQQQVVPVQTVQTEALFGPYQQALQGFTYPLSSGGTLSIRGKIDRIDTIESDKLLQVIDYKSGNKSFDLVDAYYGLDLQILTYLSVATQAYPDYKPLGAFYQPLIQGYQKGTSDTLRDGGLLDMQLSENRLKGILHVTPAQLEHLEGSLIETKKSLVYPANLTKNGYSTTTPYYDQQQLATLMNYTHFLFRQAAEQMQQGVIALQPFKHERYTPTLQNQYRVITGFDATENYQVYRNQTISKNDVLAQMQIDLEEKGGDA